MTPPTRPTSRSGRARNWRWRTPSLSAAASERRGPRWPNALDRYETERAARRHQHPAGGAQASRQWFEGVGHYLRLGPSSSVCSSSPGGQRITYDNLRRCATPTSSARYSRPGTLGATTRGVAPRRPGDATDVLPVSGPRPRLDNRVVVSPMAQYSAVDGTARRMASGAPRESCRRWRWVGDDRDDVCVTRTGRISPGCTGLWNGRPAGRSLQPGSSPSSTATPGPESGCSSVTAGGRATQVAVGGRRRRAVG